MKRNITKQDIKHIRDTVATLQGSYAPNALIFANIILPEPCDSETLDYAYKLSLALGKANCQVQISNILHFPFRGIATRDYEVLRDIPLGIPCIRVYPKQIAKQSYRTSLIRLFKERFWRGLISGSGNKLQTTI